MKPLYAEDEPAMAEAVTDILNYHNFMVDAVADGEEALAYARAGDYDGIILDIMLFVLDADPRPSEEKELSGCTWRISSPFSL